jgi:hypothetical protein
MALRARPCLRACLRMALAAGVAVVQAPFEVRARGLEATEPEAHALEVARGAFEVGLEAYRAGDYQRAVDSWTSAHRLVVLAVDDTQMERVLGFDLAQALLRLHAGDGATHHLTQVRMLLEDYILWIERPGHEITAPERADLEHAQELLALVEIDAAAAIGQRRADPLPPLPAPSPYPRIDRAPPPPTPVPIRRQRREMETYIWVGASSCSVALAFAAAAGVLSTSKREGGELSTAGANGLAAMATLTAMAGVAGLTMLSIGLVKRRALLRASPTLSRTRIGVAAELAF